MAEQPKSALNDAVFPGNSDKERKEQEKPSPPKPTLSAAPTVKKESPFLTFYRAVFSGTMQDVKRSLWDRLVNVTKDTIYNTFVGFLDDYIYNGGGRTAPNRPKSGDTNPLKYANVSKGGNLTTRDDRAYATSFSVPRVIFNTRADADSVLQSMIAILDEYRFVSVKDYLDASGMDSEYTDKYWGWYNLDGVVSKPDTRDSGYILTLPKPTYER